MKRAIPVVLLLILLATTLTASGADIYGNLWSYDVRGLWMFEEAGDGVSPGETLADETSHGAGLTAINGATGASWSNGYAVQLNGSDQYLRQRVFEDETDASWGPANHGLSLANGQAFLRVQGVNLSGFAGVEGSDTPYMVVMRDAGGDPVWGYVGAAGAGEALGSELVTNGSMEADSDWFTMGTPPVRERSNEQAHGGTYSQKLTGDDAADGFRQINRPFTKGRLYKLTMWVYPDDTTTIAMRIDPPMSLGIQTFTGLTQNAWNLITYYFTANATTNAGQLAFRYSGAGTNTWYLDNVSIKEVTECAPDGTHVVSACDGATRNWVGIDAGFDYNDDSYTFEVWKSAAQITSTVAAGAWVNTTDASGDLLAKAGAYTLTLSGGYPQFHTGSGYRTASSAVNDGDWHLVSGDWSGSAINLYVDGQLANGSASGTPGNPTDTHHPLQLGAGLAGTLGAPFLVADDLPAADHRQLYLSSWWAPDILDDLVGYWELDETSGVRYNAHNAGGCCDLTDNNTVGYTCGLIANGNAADLVAANYEYLSSASTALALQPPFTLAAWANFDELSTPRQVIGRWNPPSNDREWRMLWDPSPQRLVMQVSGDGIISSQVNATTSTVTGTWSLATGWITTDTLGIQIDDEDPDTGSYTSGIYGSNAMLTIGARGDVADRYDGALDTVALWDRELSNDERDWYYNAGAGRTYGQLYAQNPPDPPTPTPTPTPAPTPTPPAQVYTMTLPGGGVAYVSAESDFSGLLTVLGIVAVAAGLVFVFSFDLARLGSKRWL